MELGMHAEKCNCTTHCQKGVEPMGDCICRLPGDTVTAICEICDPTRTKMTWHNNGSCISCVRQAREQKKQANALRHAQIMASAPNPVQIEDAELVAEYRQPSPSPQQDPARLVASFPVVAPSPSNPANLEVVLKVGGVELSITKDLAKIQRILQCN